jgi:hypothetical protein
VGKRKKRKRNKTLGRKNTATWTITNNDEALYNDSALTLTDPVKKILSSPILQMGAQKQRFSKSHQEWQQQVELRWNCFHVLPPNGHKTKMRWWLTELICEHSLKRMKKKAT